MHPGSNHKTLLQHTAVFVSALVFCILPVSLFSVQASAAEPEAWHTVSGQELPDGIYVPEQEARKDDQNSSTGSSEVHNPEADTASGSDDNFSLEEREMIADILECLQKLTLLLTPEESGSAAEKVQDIMYLDGYEDWPYPVRVHYSMLTSEGYTTEWVVDCASTEEFKESFRNKVKSIADGALQTFSIRYVLAIDENSAEGRLVYDYANPVYPAAEELEDEEDGAKKELCFEELLSDVKSIDEKLTGMQEENQHLTVSGNDLISNLDDTIQKGNEENRRVITDLFTQGTTYILAFIGIVVGVIVGVILSRYLKHD